MSKKRRTRKAPEKVPVDSDGNLMRVARGHSKYRLGTDTFLAALALHQHYSSGASRRLVMIDTATGTTYPIFETDFLNMCKQVSMVNGEVRGEWGFCKKSTYFGVYLVQELVDGD